MNKYRDKSDFEINCQVLATFEPDIKHMCLSNDEKSFYHCGFDGNRFYETTIPDYCNNPADAMPIIFDNNISLILSHKEYPLATNNPSGLFMDSLPPENVVTNKNPLRAAMELFLMMKDAENEKV
ncbi:phage protein NinX family protein [Morganella morganii]|uniref:phage protein NinX family protein n=1 Tax=Morganella morganii TaxID=582 RepID=UPI003EBE35E6